LSKEGVAIGMTLGAPQRFGGLGVHFGKKGKRRESGKLKRMMPNLDPQPKEGGVLGVSWGPGNPRGAG